MTLFLTLEQAVERAHSVAAREPRFVLGIVGPPGAGKSTLAQLLLDALDDAAVLVPMDGFHLADVQLRRLALLERKGAPDTFDSWGYVSLLRRLREPQHGVTVYAPAFERDLEQALAGAIAVPADVPLVITEGNYLLLDGSPWSDVASLIDETWWVDSDATLRRQRLVARHVRFGKDQRRAEEFVRTVDEVNARLVGAGRDRADVIIALES